MYIPALRVRITVVAINFFSTLAQLLLLTTFLVVQVEAKTIHLKNGVDLELVEKQGRFKGIGRVAVDGFPLRDPSRPMGVDIRNPSGIHLVGYRVVSARLSPEGADIAMEADREEGGSMDWMVHSVRNRQNLADWVEPPRPATGTRLELWIKPVSRSIGKHSYRGFSYQYRYRSADIPIYRILDRSTWEPGGRAVGCEVWMRSCFVPSIVAIRSPEQFHSTEWYLPGIENPNIFQFLPLQTELQGFSFTACEKGILVTWATQVAHVRSLFEKPRGKDLIFHWHEHCGDLGLELVTAPVEVLWTAGRFDRVARANIYEDFRNLVHDALHRQLGMRRERVTTYGVVEEWGPPDFARYTRLGLPKLLALGIRTIFLPNEFENNMNVWGVSNMCCTVDYKVAESVQPERFKEFVRAARAGGARVEMWGNTSLSTLTPIFARKNGNSKRIQFLPEKDSVTAVINKARMPWVRNPSNAIEADHYTPVFAVMNLRDPDIRDYWHRSWKAAHDEYGIEAIFLDSSFNLSSDKFHFVQNTEFGKEGNAGRGLGRPEVEPPQAILSQYRAHLNLMTEMQKYGYVYCNEDLGVFGIHRHGPDIAARLDNLPIWPECLANFDAQAIRKAGGKPAEVFFKALAYRLMWMIHWDIEKDQVVLPADENVDLDLLRVFNRVNDLMVNREILPGEVGVIYRPEGAQVLWAFTEFTHRLGRTGRIEDLTAGKTIEGQDVPAEACHVYLIR